jgi:hypothetical protein
MTRLTPLFASQSTAAALLDMKPAEFRELVDRGALPGPNHYGRWDVAELQAIMRGAAAKPKEDFDL